MAKNTIYIDVEVDDNGTTKKVAMDSAKLNAQLNKQSESAQTADRRIKGLAQTSSNATKNNAKMMQGISGGLVPAYATLAAQIFAISAAYNFLKSAADFEVLAAGQVAYSKATGVAMKSLTNDIVANTNAQINFKDASQAAAIGMASGLSPDQLKELGTAARDVSAVLGRDVTDSFNRLVRGVTKAEPELLDELGIILRLETASQKYADAIGIDVKQLTAFQRSQAVANDVLEQTEEKYSKNLTATDRLGNSVAKLGKSFENNLLKPFQEGLARVITPVFDFLTKNTTALALSMGLLAVPIIKQIIPSFGSMGKAAQDAADAADGAVKQELKSLARKSKALKKMEVERVKSANQARADAKSQVQGLNAKQGSGLALLQGGGTPTPAQTRGMLRAAKENQGEYAKMSNQTRAQFIRNLEMMQAKNKMTMASIRGTISVTTTKAKLSFKKMELAYKATMAKMKAATVGFAKFTDKVMGKAGAIGVILLLAEVATMAFDKIKKLMETAEETKLRMAEEAEQKKLEELKSKLEGVNEELSKMRGGVSNKAGAAAAAYMGNVVSNIGSVALSKAFESGNKELIAQAQTTVSEFVSQMEDVKGSTISGRDEFIKLGKAISTGTPSTKDVSAFMAFKDSVQEGGTAGKDFEKTMKDLKGSQISLMNTLKKTSKFTAIINNIDGLVKSAAEYQKRNNLTADENKLLVEQLRIRQIMKILRDNETNAAFAKVQLESNYLQQIQKATPLQKQSLASQKAIDTITAQIVAKSEALAAVKASMDAKDPLRTAEQQKANELEEAKIGALIIQRDLLEEQRTLIYEIQQGARGAFEGAVTTNLKNLITGSNSSFKEAVAAIALATLDNIAGTLAKNMSEKLSNIIFGDPQETKEATQMRNALKEGADYHVKVFKAMIESLPPIPVATPVGKVTPTSVPLTRTNAAGETVHATGINAGVPTVIKGDFSEIPTLEAAGDKLVNGLDNVLKKNTDGGFLGKMSDTLGSIFGAGDAAMSIFSLFGFAKGGIVKKGITGYASGGVVKKPTLGLVGEGRQNEAVVPLPDGKTIPVSMPGGGGSTNNVSVSVIMDGQGGAKQETSSNGDQAKRLGEMVAAAVQEELQYQKRSGGILNPYGVA
tara:strand:- start:10422 stop:13784 length:3363 start_codon:yes stop_codon:yes gene_type:complete